MPALSFLNLSPQDIAKLDRFQLKTHWEEAWRLPLPPTMSNKLIAKSLEYKIREKTGLGLSYDQQLRLDQLVSAYKRSKAAGPKRISQFAEGTLIVRTWKGKKYVVTVKNGGYEYLGKSYKGLSGIASEITGTRWNGWVFFKVDRPKDGGKEE